MTRKWVRVPASVSPMLPDLVDVLRAHGVKKPYTAIGEWLGVSRSIVQKHTLAHRKERDAQPGPGTDGEQQLW